MIRRWVLPFAIFIFALLSLMTLRSIDPTLLSKQLLFFVIGAALFFLTARISFQRWQTLSPYLYGILLCLLLLTYLIGRVTRGATSWIPLGSFHMQPSQLAVVVSGLWITFLLRKHELNTFGWFLLICGLIVLPAIFIFFEPELGTTMIYLIAFASILFVSKIKWRYFFFSLASFVLIAFIGWNFFLHSWQKDRITSYFNRQDQLGASYNALQSMIAVGSGQLYGRGIGQGIQSHLRFLPERQTDFVFASFAEEMGLIGALPVVLLYGGLVFFFVFVGSQLPDRSQRAFCLLTATMIAAQVGINIGMNMGILPITGITLPLFSYGGSSILALCFQFGCIQSLLNSFQKKETLFIH